MVEKALFSWARIREGALAAALVLGCLASPAYAVEPDEILADPVLESRARDISKNLRCLVCRNQSIDDSDAGLARDLRVLVRERLTAGDSNGAVIDFVTDRYGEYVLLRPRFTMQSAALYLGGPLLLLLGGFAVWRLTRRRAVTESPDPVPLSDAERRRLDALMTERDDG